MITNLAPLRSFLAVVRHGGMSRAARRLSYSRSTVSLHVRQLEKQLQVRLINRSNTDELLTREGAALVPEVERSQEAIGNLEDKAAELAAENAAAEARESEDAASDDRDQDDTDPEVVA
ncbi:helix-turn-helix domain-containing protein [Leekyejoonella antrihumi]|nr:LysR family transcriptional regulator [Leekyejoonella antrihumi]